jgi:hypothetical protein
VVAVNSGTTKTVYSTSSSEAWLPLFVDKTYISNVETVVIQLKLGNQSPPKEKVFFCSASLGAGFTQITDADFVSPYSGVAGVGKIEHMDGFAFELLSNNIIINSDLNSLANWTSTNFITKQITADKAMGLMKFKNQILAFGSHTVEAFYNAGNATGSPLSSIKQLASRTGLAPTGGAGGSNYYAILGEKLYFLGRQSGSSEDRSDQTALSMAGLFSYDGSRYEKVSNRAIDKIISERLASKLYFGMFSFGFHGKDAIAILLTNPDPISTTQTWLMYFPEWNDWFEWNSTKFSPRNNGSFFMPTGTDQSKLYNFQINDLWQDAGTTNYTMQTQFKLPQDGHHRKRMAEFGVLADTARATNMLSVEFSDDDYVSFINIGAIDLARNIKTLNRGGSYRQRAVRLSSTNALETRLSAFVARIE